MRNQRSSTDNKFSLKTTDVMSMAIFCYYTGGGGTPSTPNGSLGNITLAAHHVMYVVVPSELVLYSSGISVWTHFRK